MFLQQLLNGLTIGATYALVAVGFSIVYSVLDLVNFAHGAFYVLSAYLVLTFFSFMQLPFWLAILFSIVGTGCLGAMMNIGILGPVRKKSSSGVSEMIATLGVATILVNLIMVLYGSDAKKFPDVLHLGKIYIGNAILRWNQVVIALMAIVVIAVLSIIVYKTRIGAAMRSISQDPVVAKLMGINTEFVLTVSFFTGILCAAIAGVMVAMYYGSIDTTMYLGVSMKTFAAALLGGIGSIPGAAVGGIIIGVLETFVSGYLSSDYQDAISFLVLIIVLIVRPTGLFGYKRTDKV